MKIDCSDGKFNVNGIRQLTSGVHYKIMKTMDYSNFTATKANQSGGAVMRFSAPPKISKMLLRKACDEVSKKGLVSALNGISFHLCVNFLIAIKNAWRKCIGISNIYSFALYLTQTLRILFLSICTLSI